MKPYSRFASAALMSRGNFKRATTLSRSGKGYSMRAPTGGTSDGIVCDSSVPSAFADLDRFARDCPLASGCALTGRIVGFQVEGSFTYSRNDSTALRNRRSYALRLSGLKSRARKFLNRRITSSTSIEVTSSCSQSSSTPSTCEQAALREPAVFLFIRPLSAAHFQCSTSCNAVVFILRNPVSCRAIPMSRTKQAGG